MLRDFDRLTTYFVVVEWSALLFAVGAVLVLRRRRPDTPRPFRTPGYPLVPLVFLVGTLVGLVAIVWGEIDRPVPNYSPLWGLLIAAAGFPVYAVWRRVGDVRHPCPAEQPELNLVLDLVGRAVGPREERVRFLVVLELLGRRVEGQRAPDLVGDVGQVGRDADRCPSSISAVSLVRSPARMASTKFW